ncbi:MAG: 5'/3'-nucleotidase SurE [Ruminococcus sp.]|nr:5'/3'-nucleotidase SurE [Ruminococcus sp.]
MRSILIVNDDGIEADGLIRLAEIAKQLGEVWVVAPDGQRSAASHAITLHGTVDIYPHSFPVEGVRAFSCSGTPADCVRVGSLSIMPHKPDIVLSGINRGLNTATDIQYSGTAGAAFEGAFQGCLSIAVSEEVDSDGEVTAKYLPELLAELTEKMPGYGQIYNINIPGCPLSEFRGILRDRAVSHGMFYRDRYKKVTDLPGGGMRFEVDGVYNEECEPGTDFRAVVENYISVGIVNNLS